MSTRKKCPKCRCDTWSEKFQQCSACGAGWEKQPISEKRVPVGPQSVHERGQPLVADNVLEQPDNVPVADKVQVDNVLPGGRCPTCGERRPSAAALKKRAWRERKRIG